MRGPLQRAETMRRVEFKLLLVLATVMAMIFTYGRVNDVQRDLLQAKLERAEKGLEAMTGEVHQARAGIAACSRQIQEIRQQLNEAAVRKDGASASLKENDRVDLEGIEVKKEVQMSMALPEEGL